MLGMVSVAGKAQLPVAGRSVRATFRSKTAPGRETQFKLGLTLRKDVRGMKK